jgi:hypothetical protein
MANHTCANCTLAKWERTTAGRLHPSGEGRCAWTLPEIPLARAFYSDRESLSMPFGGYVWRHKPYSDCPCWTNKEIPDA